PNTLCARVFLPPGPYLAALDVLRLFFVELAARVRVFAENPRFPSPAAREVDRFLLSFFGTSFTRYLRFPSLGFLAPGPAFERTPLRGATDRAPAFANAFRFVLRFG